MRGAELVSRRRPFSLLGLARPVRGACRARHAPLLAALVTGLLGAAIATIDVTRPGALHGVIQYDDGTYYAASAQLLAGRLPYRSFVFVQPPGIAVLLTPVVWLAHSSASGLAAARVCTALVAGLNAFLAGAAVRHRGVAATIVAGGLLAFDPAAFFADRTVLLEPYLVAFCLLALLAAFPRGALAGPRRLALAGALLGCGAAVKVWAVLPLAALCCVALVATRADGDRRGGGWRRGLAPVLGGALIGGSLSYLPFFAAAPGAMWHDVVVAQLDRPPTVHPFFVSLAVLVGLHGLAQSAPRVVSIACAALFAGLLLAGSAVPLLRRRADRLEAAALLSTIAAIAAVLSASEFYDHYAYFPAAFAAVSLGATVPRGRGALARRLTVRARRIAATGALAAAAGLAAFTAISETAYATAAAARAGDPAAAIDRAVPRGACAISDAPILLVVADRLDTRRTCPALVDPEGAALALAPHRSVTAALAMPALARLWESALARAAYFVRSPSARHRLPSTPGFASFLARHEERRAVAGASVFARRPPHAASASASASPSGAGPRAGARRAHAETGGASSRSRASTAATESGRA